MKYLITAVLAIYAGLYSYAQVWHPLYRTDSNINGLQSLTSDWGPRNLNGATGSVFHAGLDYNLRNNGRAYAIQAGTVSSGGGTGLYSWVMVGNWVYRHALAGEHSSLHWKLNTTIPSDNIILETVDYNDNPIIYVGPGGDAGELVTTCWDVDATTSHTASIGDNVFRSNSWNHLHLNRSNVATSVANWESPLAYIPYNGCNINNMTIALRLKRNINNIATEYQGNIIFGSEIIIESDVNYVGTYDLDVTSVEISPPNGTFTPYVNWNYTGSNHVTTDRSTGASTTAHHNLYQIRALVDIQNDIRQGIFPVYNTNDNNQLGRDIFKRHWNTKQGWNTDTPAYPDGEYTLRLTTQDVRGNVCQNPATLTRIIDNFRPYIKKVEVRKGSVNGELAYRGEWVWQTASSSMTLQTTGSGCNTTDQVWVHVYPSEPISNVTAKVNNTNCSVLSGSTLSHYIYALPSNVLQNTNSLTISSTGNDVAGNPLFEIEQGVNEILSYSLPARNASGEWINTASGDDRAHQFGATQPGQYVCHIPPSNVTATVDMFQNVNISWTPFGEGVVYRVYRSSMPNMVPKVEITSDWITSNTFTDQPVWGVWYYAVEAYQFSVNKSVSVSGCTLSESALVSVNDPNVSFYDDFYYYQSTLNNGRDVVFYVDVNNDLGYTYDLEIDYGDGEIETISLYDGYGIEHLYPESAGFFEDIYNATCSLTIYDGSNSWVDEVELSFNPIHISPAKPELVLNIIPPTPPVILGYPVKLRATLTGANPEESTTWNWCVQSQPDVFSPCDFNSNSISPDIEGTDYSEFTTTFSATGDYHVRILAYNDGRYTQVEEYMISVQDPGDTRVNCDIWPQYNISGTNIGKAGCKIRFRDNHALGSGYVSPIGRFAACGYTWNMRDFFIEKYEWYVNNELYLSQTVIYEHHGESFFLYSDDAQRLTTFDYMPTSSDIGKTIEIKLVKTARPKKRYEAEWYDAECRISNTSKKTYYITDCDSHVEVRNSKSLIALMNLFHSPVIRGSFIFSGGSSQLNVNGDLNIIARNYIKIGSGMKINGNFKASIEPCPISGCYSFEDYSYNKSKMIGMNSYEDTIQSETRLILFPNPVCDILNVEFEGFDLQQVSELVIFDVSGKIVKKINSLELKSRIDVSDLLQGSYYLSVNIGDKYLKGKFIKE